MLHHRAGDWYDQVGEPVAAVHHALAAGDLTLAADRIELAIPALMQDRQEAVLHRWARELPADAVKNRPVLAVGLIGAHDSIGASITSRANQVCWRHAAKHARDG